MKKQLILLSSILFFLGFSISNLFGQNLENGQSIKKGRLFTKDGYEKKFKSLTMEVGQVNALFAKANSSIHVSEDQIIKIEEETGNEALLWSGIMGASSLLGALLGVAQAEAQLGSDSGDNTGMVIGLTAAGALIGALYGTTKKKYKTVYENPLYSFEPNRFQFNSTSPNNVPSLTLGYSF